MEICMIADYIQQGRLNEFYLGWCIEMHPTVKESFHYNLNLGMHYHPDDDNEKAQVMYILPRA